MYKVLIAYLVSICVFSTPAYSGDDDFLELFGMDGSEIPKEATGEPPSEPDIRAIQLDGKDFVAFDPEYASMLLQMRMDYPKLELRITKLVKLLDIRGLLVKKSLEMNANMEEQLGIKDTILVGLQAQINDAYSFWRSPYLWFAVGVVLATGTTILIFEVAR